MKLLPGKASDSLFVMKMFKARDIWKQSKAMEKQNPRHYRHKHELEFLPAALEVIETPPSTTARLTTWSIIAIFVFALAWSIIGTTDIVVVAQGKTIPYHGSKPIQSLERGMVKRLLVEEGQEVKKGEVLIELDTTVSTADRDSVSKQLINAMLDAARVKALYTNPDNPDATFTPPRSASASMVQTQRQLMSATSSEYRSKLQSAENDIQRFQAEAQGIQSDIQKLEETAPLIEERAAGQMELSDKGLLPRNTALQTQQELINVRQTLAAQRHHANESKASLASAREQRDAIKSEFKRQRSGELRELQEKIGSLQQELIKTDDRLGDQSITAPEDGYVQQLAITAVGTVVEAGKELLYIVPKGEALEVEAFLLNKDWGDVDEGQEAEVKLEAFPFNKYGTIKSIIRNKPKNSVNDEKMGPVYKLRATLAKNAMEYEGRTMPLSPGMAVTLEIKTGHRRLIEFILSPIIRGFKEAGREK
jgi:hemolysin D